MIFKTLRIAGIVMLSLMVAACGTSRNNLSGFNDAELALIHNSDSIMRVLTIEDDSDSIKLRATSSDLSDEALLSADYNRLAGLMVATVTHPSQDGVGIAGPQVGINRRVVAVQRFDKEPVLRNGRLDHPFEVYPNIHIVWTSDSLAVGPEGCLSVPDRREEVLRSQEIVIEYTSVPVGRSEAGPTGNNTASLPTIRDTVKGFTAVIFQHEIDHLEGILYIDRL